MSYYQQPVYGGAGPSQPGQPVQPVYGYQQPTGQPGYGYQQPTGQPGYGYQQQQQQPSAPSYNYGNSDEQKKPGAAGDGVNVGSQLFQSAPVYHDKWASILYLVNFVIFIALGGYCMVKGGPAFANSLGNNTNNGSGSSSQGPIVAEGEPGRVYGVVVVVSLAYAGIYLALMSYFASVLITLTFWLQALLLIGYGAFIGVTSGWTIAAFIPLLIGAIYVLLWFWWRHKIPFATVMLESVVEVLREYPAMLFTVLGSVILGAGFLIFWIYAILTARFVFDPSGKSNSGATNALSIYFLFSFYWSNQVVKNITHTTLCGVYGTFYFLEGSGQNIVNPTRSAFKRAITYSFGSICYGSLIIAVVQLLRSLTNNARRDREFNLLSFVLLCISCLLSCIQDILEYMNHYAFAQVAIYGKDFCTAAKDTWTLFKSRGLDMVINDNLIGNVLGMGIFFGGVIGALVAYALAPTSQLAIIYVISGFFIGFFFIWIITEVVSSGVATIFVCLAQDPAALQRSKPALYEKFRETYPQITWASV